MISRDVEMCNCRYQSVDYIYPEACVWSGAVQAWKRKQRGHQPHLRLAPGQMLPSKEVINIFLYIFILTMLTTWCLCIHTIDNYAYSLNDDLLAFKAKDGWGDQSIGLLVEFNNDDAMQTWLVQKPPTLAVCSLFWGPTPLQSQWDNTIP